MSEAPPWDTVEARDALSDRLVEEAADGCCNNAQWRGRLCSYHQGFQAGVDRVLEVTHE